MPVELCARTDLSFAAKLVLERIYALTNGDSSNECYLTNSQLVQVFGMSARTASNVIKELVDKQIVAYVMKRKNNDKEAKRYFTFIYSNNCSSKNCYSKICSSNNCSNGVAKNAVAGVAKIAIESKEYISKELSKEYISDNQKKSEDKNQPTNTDRITTDNQNQSTLTDDLNKNNKERAAAVAGAAAGGGDVKRSPYVDTPIHRFDIPTEEQIFNFFSKALADPKAIQEYPYYQHIDAREATAIYYGNRSNNEWYRNAKKKDRVQFWNLDALNALKTWEKMRNTKKMTAEDFARGYEQTRSFTDFLPKEKEQNVLDVEYTENELP